MLRQFQNVWANVSAPALKRDIAIPALTDLWRDTQSAGEEAAFFFFFFFWVLASVVAQVGEIARSWEGSVAGPSIGCW